MTPVLTAFARSSDRGRGLARDLRVRWALEETGRPHRVRLLGFEDLDAPAHRALHPFGQIPTYENGQIRLFESGAIVMHIAERHPGLLPPDHHARWRALMWMFAALDTVELPSSICRSRISSNAISPGIPRADPCSSSACASA